MPAPKKKPTNDRLNSRIKQDSTSKQPPMEPKPDYETALKQRDELIKALRAELKECAESRVERSSSVHIGEKWYDVNVDKLIATYSDIKRSRTVNYRAAVMLADVLNCSSEEAQRLIK